MIKRNLLLVDKLKRGVLYPFPANFQLPPSVTVGEHEQVFSRTDRVKTTNGEVCPVYIEGNVNFSLDEVSDPVAEDEVGVVEQETLHEKSPVERIDNLREILQTQIYQYKDGAGIDDITGEQLFRVLEELS